MNASQECPSCKCNKYTNPQIKFMVNICGHILCDNCVEVLYVRGSGLCVTCKIPIRKANFRSQLFEDPLVQKEVETRKKILNDFNKRSSDFASIEEYDLYLEKLEEIIHNLVNDINLDETKRFIEQYKRDNKDHIKKNRVRPPECMEFYESILHEENANKEKYEKEYIQELEEWQENRRKATEEKLKTVLGDENGITFVSNKSDKNKTETTANTTPDKQRLKTPQSTFNVPASASIASKIFQPQSAYQIPPSAAVIARNRTLGIPPSVFAPGSAMQTPVSSTQWATNASKHHNVTLNINKVFKQPQSIDGGGGLDHLKRAKDTVKLGKAPPAKKSKINMPEPYYHKPFEFELFGPKYPSETHFRWADIKRVYDEMVIEPLKAGYSKGPRPDDFVPGLSDDLPIGACGISPYTFLHRELQESRVGLFI